MLIGVSGCGGDDDQAGVSEVAPTKVTEYVGTVSGVDPKLAPKPGDYFVAVAIDQAGGVEAYMCDGTGNGQSLVGRVENDQLDLKPESGEAKLAATVADSEMEGGIELRGQTLSFHASAARDVGGLYTFTTNDGLRVSGESERGNTVTVKATAEDRGEITGRVTTAEGKQRPLEFELTKNPSAAYDEFRVVILNGGQFRGNRTVGAQKLPSAGARFTNVPAG